MNFDKQELADVVKTKVLPVIVILAVVVIFYALVSDANKPETPAPPPPTQSAAPPSSANPAKQAAKVEAIAKKSDGNWDHLSAADQSVLNGVTGGHGRQALPMMTKRFKNMAKHPPPVHKSHP